MENQCFGRQQRHKLQLLFLLAVCVWLVYQIKHCINKRTDKYGGETKLAKEEFVLDGTLEAKVEHHKEQGNKKYPKTPSVNNYQSHYREPPPHEYDVHINSDGSNNTRIISEEEESKMQENEVESTNVGITERTQGFHNFQDENGVPYYDSVF